eukprot:scaffold1590_cov239-Pinguiococcus_pyrenoidosus.AAC.15
MSTRTYQAEQRDLTRDWPTPVRSTAVRAGWTARSRTPQLSRRSRAGYQTPNTKTHFRRFERLRLRSLEGRRATVADSVKSQLSVLPPSDRTCARASHARHVQHVGRKPRRSRLHGQAGRAGGAL